MHLRTDNYIFLSRLSILFLIIYPTFFIVHGDSLLDTVDFLQKGDLASALSKSSEIASSSDADSKGSIPNAYAITAIIYVLQDSPDTHEKCLGLLELLEGSMEGNPSEKDKLQIAHAIISYLSGKMDEPGLVKVSESWPQDWKAVATLAQYLSNLKKKADSSVIFDLSSKYGKYCAGYTNIDWPCAWLPRMKIWNLWVQKGEGDKAGLEKLIAENAFQDREKYEKQQCERKYVAVSESIETFIEGGPEKAATKASKEVESLKEMKREDNAAALQILEFIAGKNSMSFQQIFTLTHTDPQLWSLGAIASFVKSATQSSKPESYILLQSLDNYKKNFKSGNEVYPVVTKWEKKVERWSKWCDSGFKNTDGIEPVFVSSMKQTAPKPQPAVSETASKPDSSPKKDTEAEKKQPEGQVSYEGVEIADIDPDEFAASREEKYKDRPRPQSLEFNEKAMNKYFESLSPEIRKLEELRYKNISGIIVYLVRMLERNQYPKGLKLKRGKVSGTVYMANENVVVIRKGKKKTASYKWEELHIDQFVNFLTYYANVKSQMQGGGEITQEQAKKNAAQDYLLAAILCDWYGKYSTSLKLGEKVLSLDSSLRKSTMELLTE